MNLCLMKQHERETIMAENDINNEEQYIKAAERLKNYISSIDFKFSNKEEIEKIYEDFRNEYSPEKLAGIPDNYLVDKLFLSGNQKNLCHDLEFDRKYLIFGAIFGGSSFKYPIFKRDGKWITGNPQSFVELSQDEALVKARSIKDLLIKTYNVIKQYNFNTLNDYVNFYGKLEKEIKEFLEPLWVRKYYHMMFPNLFINFHKNELQEHILLGLGVIPGSTYYERCGQLIEVNKNLGWYQLDFSNACLNKFSGNIKSFYRIGSTDSSGKKYAEEWKEKGIVAIGWKELGDLRQYDNGKKFDTDKVKEKLLETNNNYKTIAPTKSKEIKNFYKSDENSIFVVADGEKIIGLVDNIGEYGFDSNNHMSNYKKCNWATIFQDNIKFPNKNEWYLTSCVKITNKENLLFLYNLYYWNERKLPSKIIVSTNNKIDNPINTILYGPPGTGKTYNTVIKAIEIINKDCIKYDDNGNVINYDEVKNEFDKAKKAGRIEFITFHQSYSYEEFVEGIKPDLPEWNNSSDSLTYKGTNGVFKEIVYRALFDRLEIKEDKKNKILNFGYIKDKFIEKYQVGDELETIKSKSKFKIEKYTEDSVRIRPYNSEYIYSVSFNYLEEAFNKNLEKDEDIINIVGMPKGIASYYRSIYSELIDLYNIEIKNSKDKENNRITSNEEISSEQKLRLIKEYYENNEENKISLKDINESKKYVLIIDEINRGNISKIFGELITLLEEDKRESFSVRLPYSKEEFTVPKNLYIIGTMNTSDRSIATIDIALRRRFTFKEMMPDEKQVPEKIHNNTIELRNIFNTLNERIKILLDRDHQIGHSYFMNVGSIEDLKSVWFNCVMPLLNEYFYNDWEKLVALLGEADSYNDNNKCQSFIRKRKIEKTDFAYKDYECNEENQYDFTNEDEIDFEKALENAFGK